MSTSTPQRIVLAGRPMGGPEAPEHFHLARVPVSTPGPDKCACVRDELGVDACIDHRGHQDVRPRARNFGKQLVRPGAGP